MTSQALRVKQGQARVVHTATHDPVSGDREVMVSLRGVLRQANAAPEHDGKLMLRVSAELDGPHPVRAMLQIPLASVAEAYGESRSCTVGANGTPTVLWTAGLDEKNFVPFAAATSDREFHFLINKYLCRLLAAPVRCGGREVALPRDVAHWRLGRITQVVLQSQGAPAGAEVSDVTLWSSEKRFDYAQCAALAPSDGTCCVQGKLTAWHCGGSPAGTGWRQVSGDCFHREIGGSCPD